VSGRAEAGLDAALALAWMREHGDALRRFLAEEGEGDDAPAGDPAIRAHLRLAAAAIEATAAPDLAAELEGLADGLPEWFEEHRDLYEHHLDTGEGAIALEEHLQFGTLPGSDPSLDAALHRRLRIWGWVRLTALAVEARLGPAADGLGAEALAWIGDRQRDLSRLILALDREAKARAARAPGRGAPADLALLDEIGQAATVQANVRMLVEALAATLPAGPTAPR
jgi:hypothetical protein